ncbi:MAG: GNAT family N-acetyltransferase [Pelatocladus maniniholoensis HA4357-MV3]|jgi:ribosomal-protein-alanine N-acetyltransferase|uniref:GNAT family N-acetyltransferase n=1 Tax=Pelatocladus maniniholoensis HA4357-MV3 TaxID=1117104 RepID=A0A9E3H4U7_9NOST|nr:GNAT family N-acetyltransferase [Pelatocladus maniniholoensis HA4357-MV3]BAZ67940.1 putative acetyltransferase [Fischerella sp. NIES-4106]
MIVIETPRLILRHFTLNDVDELAAIYADPIVTKFYPRPYTHEQTQQQVERIMNMYKERGWSLWATIYKADHQLIGRCGLMLQLVDEQQEVEIGYLLAKEYWGQGLATEAAIACRNYGFQELGLNRLISLIDPRNIASQKVAIKNGMKHEKNAQMWDKSVCVYTIQK